MAEQLTDGDNLAAQYEWQDQAACRNVEKDVFFPKLDENYKRGSRVEYKQYSMLVIDEE